MSIFDPGVWSIETKVTKLGDISATIEVWHKETEYRKLYPSTHQTS